MRYHPESNGIVWNGKHSCTDFDATCKERQTPPPKEIKRQERVAYSNVTWNFGSFFGVKEYENRTLRYTFVISDNERCREKADAFIDWLEAPDGFSELWDSVDPLYHFRAQLTSISTKYQGGVVCELTVIFEAYPYRIPNEDVAFPVDPDRYPDIDDDGQITAADAQAIQTAAANIGAGEPSGLTPEQEFRADADRDGTITAIDAQLVLSFTAACGAGDYSDTPAGWTDFLNDQLSRRPEVI